MEKNTSISEIIGAIIVLVCFFFAGILIGVKATEYEAKTYYKYVDKSGDYGYASTCKNDTCISGSNHILVQSFEAITEK